ncbi:MAG TPA: DUF2017 family protein [Actinomycetota bacterium]|nr:DUF2017 family protein [Actinomycetota bacterium]
MRVTGGEGLVLYVEEHEAGLLRQLVDESRRLLEADVPREDPVIARLFPDAYEDPEDARSYEEMVGSELRAAKLDGLRMVGESLGQSGDATVELSPELTSAWLAWLTDVRLAVGTRLGVTEEKMGEEVDPGSPDAPAWEVLHWLGWIQESIIQRLGPLPGSD